MKCLPKYDTILSIEFKFIYAHTLAYEIDFVAVKFNEVELNDCIHFKMTSVVSL